MKTYLIPVDFSSHSLQTLRYAAQLAKSTQAHLCLLHAYMLPTPVTEVPYIMAPTEALHRDREQQLNAEAKQLETDYGLKCTTVVRLGIPSDEIREFIEKNNPDLVIMGMKSPGGLGTLIGSTTISLIRKTQVPLLIIPEESSFSELREIVYATDFRDTLSASVFTPLFALTPASTPKLRILYVQTLHSPEPDELLPGKKLLELAFQNYPHDYQKIESRNVTEGVHEHLLNFPADLLVMVAHPHGFLEHFFIKNHTAAMAYETSIPLLILHDKV